MPRAMRREYQVVTDQDVLERWLHEAVVGRLATVDEDGYPVIKPVNFVYHDGSIYFHGASAGEKLDDIARCDRVGFEVDHVIAVTPPPERGCQTHCLYRSVIIRGRARVLVAAEDAATKRRALELLIAKHSDASAAMSEAAIQETAVVEIRVEHMTGKEDLGQRWSPERKRAVARLLVARDGDSAREAVEALGLAWDEMATAD